MIPSLEQALEGGARCFQLREKDLSPNALLELALEMNERITRCGGFLIINDRADIAEMAGAAGVHLTENSVPASAVKKQFPRLKIGVSTHTLEGALNAEKNGADFITFSPIFETPSKKEFGPPQGLDRLKEVIETTHIPVLALGGVKKGHLETILNLGAHGVAMISGIWSGSNIEQNTFEYIKILSRT
ncbi:MAG: thiamine phosphate synthase [Candidatus Nitrohelix vancouverensis]|uniref:Thiamine phosphate synthase n=1 Tax=Candidatus Nitrohelix vancouverensis TaxID=2705534 RepID=A0A7T0C554_9BACT|nr:MAG: thiamine phosphate synthase [Candidatus Nitrohelix vancouverensis]